MRETMNLLEMLWASVWEASWQGGLLVVAVILLQRAFGRRLPAQWRYALWIPVLLRLLLPALPSAPFSLYQWLPEEAVTAPAFPQKAAPPVEVPPLPAAAPPVVKPMGGGPISPSAPPVPWIACFWAIGAGVFLLTGLASCRRLQRRAKRLAVPTPPLLAALFEEERARLGLRRVRLLVTDAASGPMATGLWQALILLPPGLEERRKPEEIALALRHEMTHVRRGDLFIVWLAWLAGALHWFNPMIWYALALLRRDRELACDEALLRDLPEPQKYGEALLAFLENRTPPRTPLGAVGIFEGRPALMARLRQIATYRRPTFWGGLLGVTLVVALGLGTLTRAAKSNESDLFPPEEQLTEAIETGDSARVRKILRGKVDLEAKTLTRYGHSKPLERAILWNHEEIARLLVEAGASLTYEKSANRSTSSWSEWALQMGHPAIARYLHEEKGDPIDPLLYAAGTGESRALARLLPEATPEARKEAAKVAARCNQPETLRLLLDEGVSPDDLFLQAARTGALQTLELLTEKVDLQAQANEAAQSAISRGSVATLRFLLERGAKLNTDSSLLIDTARSPFATEEQALEIATLLLDAGFDPNRADGDQRQSALHVATMYDQVKLLRLLLDRGGKADLQDAQQMTPYHCALYNRAPRCVRLFLEAGADPNAVTPHGNALGLAQLYLGEAPQLAYFGNLPKSDPKSIRNATQVVTLLLQHGADPNRPNPGPFHQYPLATAMSLGQQSLVIPLLHHGAEVNLQDKEGISILARVVATPFLYSTIKENISNLLERGADPNLGLEQPPQGLAYATSLKAAMNSPIFPMGTLPLSEWLTIRREMVGLLLRHGARFPVREGTPQEALLLAATRGENAKVSELLRTGLSPDSADDHGWTPLMSAVALNHQQVIQTLIHAGADVKAEDAGGIGPLYFAVITGNDPLALQILEAGFDPHWKVPPLEGTVRESLISLTVSCQRREVLRWLLEHGVEPDTHSLSHALANEDLGTLRLLIGAGASTENLSYHGENPEIKALLENHQPPRPAPAPKQAALFAFYAEAPTGITFPSLSTTSEDLFLNPTPVMTGEAISSLSLMEDQPGLILHLTPEGTQRFREVTQQYLKKQIAIVFEGRQLIAPVIQGVIQTKTLQVPLSNKEEAQAILQRWQQAGKD